MTIQAVREARDTLRDTDELGAEVYTCFLTQPQRIGPNADNLTTLNFQNPEHRGIYLRAVDKDIDALKERSGFRAHEAILQHYRTAKELLFQ